MSQWIGASRTNFVRIEDLEGLSKEIDRFAIFAEQHRTYPDYYAIFTQNNKDTFGSVSFYDNESGDNVYFDLAEHVMPYVARGEVLVSQSVGTDGHHYVSASAYAYVRDDKGVRRTSITLQNIYDKAVADLQIESLEDIATCEYNNIPKSVKERYNKKLGRNTRD